MAGILRLAILLSVIAAGCKTLSTDHRPVHHSPFAKTRWKTARWPLGDHSGEGFEAGSAEARDDIRARMVAEATTLLEKGRESPGFGAEDVDQALANLKVSVPWRAGDGLAALVSLARERGAFDTGGEPLPGDIVLFHNQLDQNANRENDDWLTGAGIVLKTREETFDAVIRTGHAPRRITACPSRPSHRTRGGEVINTSVRIPTGADPRDTAYLAGQLYAGHIDIEELAAE